MDRLDFLAIGEYLVDCTQERIGEDGFPVLAAHPGGAPANFLAAAAKYGARTALIASVGEDPFGRLLLAAAQKAGVGTGLVQSTSEAFTTFTLVTRDGNGEREFAFARKPGADTMLRATEEAIQAAENTRVLHFGSVSLTGELARATHEKLIACARERGAWISFDPNLRKPLWPDLEDAREQILWGLAQADVVKISDDEVRFLFALAPEEGAKKILAEFNVALVFVTCGGEGAVYCNANACGRAVPAVSVQPVDTTGAGDIFGGSAWSRILESEKAPRDLREEDLVRITTFACTAASISTTRLGGLASVPEESEVLAAMQSAASE